MTAAPRPARRRRWLTVGLACAVGASFGCSPATDRSSVRASASDTNQAAGATKTATLVWGGPKNISMLPILADQKGFFREAGLDVRPNYVQTGKIAMDALVSRDLHFSVIVETNIAFVKFQEGADIKVVGSIMEKYDDALIARADRGIRRPKDLEGKTVAYLPGTTSHRFIDRFIEYHKLDRNRIKLINLTPPGIQAGILSGTIDGGSVWQPFRYNVQRQLGAKAIQFADRGVYTAYVMLAVRPDFAERNPEQIRAFLRALIRAEEFARDNRDEAIAILAKELAMDPAVLAAIWDEYVLRVRLDESLQQVFVQTGQWVRTTERAFQDRTVPAYDDVLDGRFLRAVDATRVAAHTGG
jgi:NitT/TauT family transport system substrate-binding protein